MMALTQYSLPARCANRAMGLESWVEVLEHMSKRLTNRHWVLLMALAVLAALTGCTRQKRVEPTPPVTATSVLPQAVETKTPQMVPPTEMPTAVETPAIPPPTQAPTAGPAQGLKLNPQVTREESQPDRFTLEVSVPYLVGAPDAITQGFNGAVEAFVTETLTSFKTMARESAASGSVTETGCFLSAGYEVEGVINGVLSVRFEVEQYAAGAAHPGHATYVLNYELATGRLLPLATLFRGDADYLKAISDYSVAELKKRGTLLFEDGAEPKAENYLVWNLRQNGLLITFDEYQVAPYAAGPQTVLVPYAVLRDVLDPEGPLAPFAK